MIAKFTPGPWKAFWSGTYYDIRVSEEEGGEDIWTYSPHFAIVIQNSLYRHTSGLEKQEANAHLIAAAPAMYEALERIAEYWNGGSDSAVGAIETVMEIAEAALAKAEGRDSE